MPVKSSSKINVVVARGRDHRDRLDERDQQADGDEQPEAGAGVVGLAQLDQHQPPERDRRVPEMSRVGAAVAVLIGGVLREA